MRKILLSLMALLTIFVGCSDSKDSDSNNKKLPEATVTMKDGAVFVIELDVVNAPNTAHNFIYLAKSKFYDGIKFHRVVPDFVLQGGDPEGTGAGGPGYSIEGEFSSNGSENDLKNELGTIAMARTNDPNSAGSQFYINLVNNVNLDGDYAVFGRVVKGMDVVNKIVENYSTGSDDLSTIETITIDTFGEEYPEPEKIENGQ